MIIVWNKARFSFFCKKSRSMSNLNTENSTLEIAFIGLGLMGYPMVENLAKSPSPQCKIHVWNRTLSKASDLQSKYPHHIIVESIPKQAISNSVHYILISLFDYQAIEQTLLQEDILPLLRGKTIIQTSTIGVEESLKMSKLIEQHGGAFVECPVLGTNTVAAAGKLQLLFGCTPSQFEQIKSVHLMDTLGTSFYIGQVSKALQIKLTFNLMVGSLTGVLANALGLLKQNDLPVETFMEILKGSAFYFKYVDVKLPRMLERNYEDPNFSTSGLLKDFQLIEQLAQQSGVYQGLIHSVVELCEKRVKESETHGKEDFASVYEVMNPKKQ